VELKLFLSRLWSC